MVNKATVYYANHFRSTHIYIDVFIFYLFYYVQCTQTLYIFMKNMTFFFRSEMAYWKYTAREGRL